jgi:DNA gyrase/topoisomerase IV subunit A
MKNVVSCLYSDYLRYIDKFRAIPWQYDLLKPVERRILLAAHEEAPNKLVKSAKVVGACLAKYHPHGDASCYDTLVRMVNNKFLIGQGNFGAFGWEDDNPAALRYTECKASPSLDKAFGEFLDFVPWEALELDPEPHYLPFYLPIGLMGEGLIQGISLNPTVIPKYNPKDLLTRLIDLLEGNPTKTIIPNLGTNQVYENSPGEYERILTTGRGIIQCVPNIQVTNAGIHIFSRNPINGFNKLKSHNEQYEEKNKIPFFEHVDLSQNGINVFIKPKRGPCNNDFIMEVMKCISCRVHVICNVVIDNGTVECRSIDSLLIGTYNKWKEAYLNKLNKDLEIITLKIYEYNIILIVRNIIENNPTVKTIKDIVALNTNPQATPDEIEKICSKHRIKQLIEANIDLPALTAEKQNLEQNILNIDTIAFNRVKSLL